MKIVFLGTGDAYTTTNRGSVGILIPDEGILLDTPPDILYKLNKINYDVSKIKSVFISHLHGDHAVGLLFLFLYSKYKSKKIFNLVLPRKSREKLSRAYKIFFDAPNLKKPKIFAKEVNTGEYTINGIKFFVKETRSTVNNLSYRLIINKKSIVYSGDTYDDLSNFAKNCNLLIHESAIMDEKYSKKYGHSTPFMAIQTAKKANANTLALVHLSKEVEKKIPIIKKYAKRNNVKLIIPNDLQQIEI
ncbi:MAG: MBL fold metallo-hydrolase [Candidatus Parvarchaeota archaeon]|nr:MBL fold metallo-hydrolase [Candidatus Jingweiarchaeum tengchongense]MCW1298273.1 MBL fold metallo-hydrolase [Candidatus Jingweiarchaeum tengchongense]MCW1300364.1 MBL fold metallo-hydrolase [Candidatus Jingweiarchaeum tengchongense]MCW1304791.1 MBL fold metallo-hydrolase [Candidatus Jingweiarchaeum tengchongense]MCW1305381.1 MBL fold metallo-hydrolase [Candidatus Jingweiarchaeum tengchongense]